MFFARESPSKDLVDVSRLTFVYKRQLRGAVIVRSMLVHVIHFCVQKTRSCVAIHVIVHYTVDVQPPKSVTQSILLLVWKHVSRNMCNNIQSRMKRSIDHAYWERNCTK